MEINEALPEYKRYTYADYCTWDDDERRELIDGVPYALAAPSWQHQAILTELFWQIRNQLKDKTCKVFVAPFDVRLNADSDDVDVVVQPDIVVICDRSIISGTGCIGAPDLIIEILSPSSAAHDRLIKFKRYLQYGVREYWIVDPETKSASVHILENGKYYITIYSETDAAPVHVLEGCTINLSDVFEE